ncbi:MAG: glycosyltransferase, partial [Planctomycetales bacterium]
MFSLWFSCYLLLTAAALFQALIGLYLAWDHYHHTHARYTRNQFPENGARAALLSPCKGRDVKLEENLLALLEQDHPNFEVIFVVESEQDPACPVIRDVINRRPRTKAKLVVAGISADCGQKIHNLLAATEAADPRAAIFAFVDSDAGPRPDWLRNLARPLRFPKIGAVTAYRSFLPTRDDLPHRVLCSINGMVSGLIGSNRTRQLIWGGSWSVRREDFEKHVRPHWKQRICDDLSATQAIMGAGLVVDFEPRAMVASPLRTDW